MNTLMDGLYHSEIYMPFQPTLPDSFTVNYSQHAKQAAVSDKYGRICLPSSLRGRELSVVEAEVTGGKLSKLVVRTRYNDRFDLVLVISTNSTVRTVWLNSRTDSHKTLNWRNYRPGPATP